MSTIFVEDHPAMNKQLKKDCISVMVSMLASRAIDCGFESMSVKLKTIKLVFSASPLRSKSNDWLVLYQDHVSKCNNMPTCGLLFQ